MGGGGGGGLSATFSPFQGSRQGLHRVQYLRRGTYSGGGGEGSPATFSSFFVETSGLHSGSRALFSDRMSIARSKHLWHCGHAAVIGQANRLKMC